jgi:hypothetical protein
MKLDEFVRASNLVRYVRMLAESNDEAQRQTIRKLLVEELAKHEQGSGTRRRASDGAAAIRPAPLMSDARSERARIGSDRQPRR